MTQTENPTWTKGFATSFADKHDVAAFNECKREGKSDAFCFRVGDNGVGFWGDDCTQQATPFVALPPEDIIARWGSMKNGRGKKVTVHLFCSDADVICIVGDVMPHKEHIRNGACIDLGPGALNALGVRAPLKTLCRWAWTDDFGVVDLMS